MEGTGWFSPVWGDFAFMKRQLVLWSKKWGPSPVPTGPRLDVDYIPVLVIPLSASTICPVPLQNEPLAPVKNRARDVLVTRKDFLRAVKVHQCCILQTWL